MTHYAGKKVRAFLWQQLGNTMFLFFSTGFFRDTLGSYDNFYRMLGAVNLFVAALMFMFLWQDHMRKKMFKLPRMNQPSTGKPVCARGIECPKDVRGTPEPD